MIIKKHWLKVIFSLCSTMQVLSASEHLLPEGGNVVAGTAEFTNPDADTMRVNIHTDKAIIHYDRFNIGENKTVEFVQPKSSSSVLNRVQGNDVSNILGNLKSNGKVFLVNPNGVYFGPKAMVNTASLIASTLDIADQDFLNDQYQFLFKEGVKGSIINEGTLSTEGVIALLSPYIKNTGTVIAQAGNVFFGAGQKVTLDFTGDGLVNFIVEGELGDALVEHLGKISALEGEVALHMKVASRVLNEIVNTDGIEEGLEIVKEQGAIRLAPRSEIAARAVKIETTSLDADGAKVSAGDLSVNVNGKATIRDSANDPFVAYVLRGFVFQAGFIDIFALANKQTTIASGGPMTWISPAPISADAHFAAGAGFSLQKPDGTPGDFASLEDPIISATGGVSFGSYSGPSLKVESTGPITTGAISITGPDASLSGSGDSDASTLSSTSACILRAGLMSLQGFGSPVPPSQTASGTIFNTAAGTGSMITLNGNITTAGGPVILAGNVQLGQNVTISTSNYDLTITGTVDGNHNLTVNLGTGNAAISGAVGSNTALSVLTIGTATNFATSSSVSALSIAQPQNSAPNPLATTSTTFGGAVTTTGSAGITINCVNMTFQGTVTTTNNGPVSLYCSQASGVVTLSGAVVADGGFTQTGVGTLNIGANITAHHNNIGIGIPVNLTAPVTLTTSGGGGNINFTQSIDGAYNLTLNAGAGSVQFAGVVGSNTPLADIVITNAKYVSAGMEIHADSFTQSAGSQVTTLTGPVTLTSATGLSLTGSTFFLKGAISINNGGGISVNHTGALQVQTQITIDGAFSQIGSGSVVLSNTITTNSSAISITGPVSLVSPTTLDTTNSGGSTGAPITFSSTVDGGQNLTLKAGTDNVIFNDFVGGSIPLAVMTVTANAIDFNQIVYSASEGIFTAPGGYNLNAGQDTYFISNSGGFTFGSGTINLAAGTNFNVYNSLGVVGGAMSFANLQGTGIETVYIYTEGSLATNGGPVTLGSVSNIDSLIVQADDVKFNGAITASVVNIQSDSTIFNASTPVTITTSDTATFNALGGDVGTSMSNIAVDASGGITAGATGNAYFSSTVNGETVESLSSNPPVQIYLNGNLQAGPKIGSWLSKFLK